MTFINKERNQMITYIVPTDSQKSTLQLNEGEYVHNGVVLFGASYTQYGEQLWENLLHILENFSNDTPPSSPVEGQIWYDRLGQTIKVFNGTSWNNAEEPVVQSTPPVQIQKLWFDTTTNRLKVYVNSSWVYVSHRYFHVLGDTVTGNLTSTSSITTENASLQTCNINDTLINNNTIITDVISDNKNDAFTLNLKNTNGPKITSKLPFVIIGNSSGINESVLTIHDSSDHVMFTSQQITFNQNLDLNSVPFTSVVDGDSPGQAIIRQQFDSLQSTVNVPTYLPTDGLHAMTGNLTNPTINIQGSDPRVHITYPNGREWWITADGRTFTIGNSIYANSFSVNEDINQVQIGNYTGAPTGSESRHWSKVDTPTDSFDGVPKDYVDSNIEQIRQNVINDPRIAVAFGAFNSKYPGAYQTHNVSGIKQTQNDKYRITFNKSLDSGNYTVFFSKPYERYFDTGGEFYSDDFWEVGVDSQDKHGMDIYLLSQNAIPGEKNATGNDDRTYSWTTERSFKNSWDVYINFAVFLNRET